MAEKDMREEKIHTLSLVARKAASVYGVTEVDSFDELCVMLKTDCGDMTIEGKGLHVGTLDIARGVVEITGQISAIYYAEETRPKRGLRTRLLG